MLRADLRLKAFAAAAFQPEDHKHNLLERSSSSPAVMSLWHIQSAINF